MKDFTPTAETISLHGLGFIQVVLPGNQRLHVWHPDLPRRDCYDHSAIHNHRFSFDSRVLKGVQRNVRVDLELVKDGTHTVISHNGPRSDKGGRLSYPVAQCNVHEREVEFWGAGGPYWTADRNIALQFARREDAERLCAEDEDAWRIESVNPKS